MGFRKLTNHETKELLAPAILEPIRHGYKAMLELYIRVGRFRLVSVCILLKIYCIHINSPKLLKRVI